MPESQQPETHKRGKGKSSRSIFSQLRPTPWCPPLSLGDGVVILGGPGLVGLFVSHIKQLLFSSHRATLSIAMFILGPGLPAFVWTLFPQGDRRTTALPEPYLSLTDIVRFLRAEPKACLSPLPIWFAFSFSDESPFF